MGDTPGPTPAVEADFEPLPPKVGNPTPIDTICESTLVPFGPTASNLDSTLHLVRPAYQKRIQALLITQADLSKPQVDSPSRRC